jgi:hypothetical protein
VFHVNNFAGYGNLYSAGFGATISYGGTTDKKTSFSENIDPNQWGKTIEDIQ